MCMNLKFLATNFDLIPLSINFLSYLVYKTQEIVSIVQPHRLLGIQ